MALAAILLTVASGCGFRPLYAQRPDAPDVATQMADVFIPLPVRKGRAEQQLYNDLRDRLNPAGIPEGAAYRLDVNLSVTSLPVALRRDESATRQNVNILVNYALRRNSDNTIVTQGLSRAVAAYNIVRSAYATVVAAEDAERRAVREASEDVRTQLAVYFSARGKTPGS